MRNIKARTHACTCAQVADSEIKAQRMGRFLGLGLLLDGDDSVEANLVVRALFLSNEEG